MAVLSPATSRALLKSFSIFLLFTFVLTVAPAKARAHSTEKGGDKLTRTVTEYTLPPDKLAKSTALRKTRMIAFAVSSIYGFALLLLFLYARWTVTFRDIAERVSRRLFVQAWIFVPLFIVSLSVLDLPPEIYSHHLSRAYGLSVQGWPSWFADWGKALGLEIVFGTLILWLMYLIIRKSPRRCWFYCWLIALPIMVFLVFVEPVVIEPMFYKFTPLEQTNSVLVSQIDRVVHRGGLDIPSDRMFEMNASSKTNELNAYVAGFGATKRVVVWDTTEQKMTTPQTLFVFGHEMGHYVMDHIWKGMIFAAGLMFPLFYFGYRLSLWLIRVNGGRWGILNLGDWASLPALILVISALSFFSEPIDNGFSRFLEHHADIYGLEVTQDIVSDPNQAAAQAFQVLGEVSLDYPYPNRFLVWWFDSHPSIPDRVRFAVNYDPWAKGESPQFVK